MSKGVAITDIVASIEKNNSAVLFLDTCAILDIVRALSRNNVEAIQAAKKIIEEIDSDSVNCIIVLSSLIEGEYNENIESVKKELEAYFKNIADSSKSFYDANKVFGNDYNFCNFRTNPLTQQIISLAYQFIANSTSILEENDLKVAAYHRAVNNIAPASKGKPEPKDCLIVEECLEVCRQFKHAKKNVPLLFLSSNASDFCSTETKILKQELIKEFQANGLQYCYSWGNVLSELLKNKDA